MTQYDLGKRVKEIRDAMHLSQLDFATLCDLQAGYITNLEKGIQNPTLETINKIAAGLNITASALIAEDTPEIDEKDKWINKVIGYMRKMTGEDRKRVAQIIYHVSKMNREE